MIKLLKYRAALISVLFGLFGGALSKLLVIDEMSGYYPALACLIGLVISLMISFLLKGKWNRSLRNNIKLISVVLFTGLLASIYLHTKYFIEATVPIRDFEGKTSYYVKGYEYSALAKKVKGLHPEIISDADLITEVFSPDEKDRIWTPESIQENLLKLITSYCILIIFFVTITSVLMEVLVGHYARSTLKTY